MKEGEATAGTTSISDTGQQPPAQDVQPSVLQRTRKRGIKRFFDPRNLVGFLWLGPALALLVLNFKNHIIGSGLNCGSHCRIDPYSTDRVTQIARLEETNRDVLGALQFVAKALEVWFMYVAASFIYRLCVFLSLRDHRLPISLLLVYAEFMDLLYIKDLAMKTRALAMEKKRRSEEENPRIETESRDPNQTVTTTSTSSRPPPVLYIFIVVVAALCVVANLMGVATATLVLPALQWIDINQNRAFAFNSILSSQPPAGAIIPGCSETNLADGIYSCTANLYGPSLDALVEAAVASERQVAARYAYLLPPVSQEANMSASANISDNLIVWAPLRQVLRELSADLDNYDTASSSDTMVQAYPDSHRFNQSLEARLQRIGPTVGLVGDCFHHQGPDIFNLSSDREVRCYPNFDTDIGIFSKCIPWGPGWADSSSASSASFTIADVMEQSNMEITLYTTPSARYVDSTGCLGDQSCDWEQIFSDPPDTLFQGLSNSQHTFDYTLPHFTPEGDAAWCDGTVFLSFAAYSVTPSPVSNLLQLVQLGVLYDDPEYDESNTDQNATLSFHADWMLAGWSADSRNGTVPGNRGSSSRFIDALQSFISPDGDDDRFIIIHQYTVLQALSLIPYTTTTPSTAEERRAQADRERANPYTAATLTSWGSVQVWKYGVDSRTKRLSVVILIIGGVVVVATSIFWLESPKSPTVIIVDALQHEPPTVKVPDEETGVPLSAEYQRDSTMFVYTFLVPMVVVV
ncbi:hypothetical protein BJX70DRAFT_387626 [Aspergillus crustosus]